MADEKIVVNSSFLLMSLVLAQQWKHTRPSNR